MALVKPECAAHLPRTEIERHVSVGHAVAGDLVRAFRRPDRRDLVKMIFRAAEAVAPCKARGDSGRGATTPLAGDHMDCQRRADVGARLFRLCSPVVTTLLDDFGFSMSSPMNSVAKSLRLLWAIPECRCAFGVMRCMWFAPHLAQRPPDELPVERLVCQMQRLLEAEAHVFSTRAGLPSDAIPYISVHNLTVRIMQAVIPLWEDTAASMGLPRNFEGVARLTRAVTTSRDPRIVELAWATIAVPADGPRLVRAQQLLCDL